MKQETEGAPDLEAAFDAVMKAGFSGPLDPGFVKLKFNEIVKDAKEKRELEMDPRAAFGGARDDREKRDRKDRDHQHMTLTALLASNAAYRALHEEIMAQLLEVESLLDDNQEKLDATVDREKKALRELLERHAVRLPDGRSVFKGTDKHGNDVIVDETFKPVQPEEAEGVDFTGKMTLDEYRERRKPLEIAIEMAEPNRRDQVRVGEIRERNTDQNNPLSMEQKEADKVELGEIKERAQERQRELSKVAEVSDAPAFKSEERAPNASASMAKPQI